ncbi:MAG TPA: hypothetical protein PKW32_11775 [Verrucomicrobiota bacterium]|nr:hypothetical protein [Verrucomicrobiota bacterium]
MCRRIGFLAAVFLVPRLWGQPMPPPQEAILERGPHHQVIQSTRWELNPEGVAASRASTYTQLETGLNYWDQGQWRAAVEQIELYAGGAVARQGQQAVIFARNLLAPEGTIDLGTVDGVRLRSRPLGLAYYDPVSGQDAIIATVKESLGEVVPPNQVVYPDAFDTVSGSIIYTWRKRGLSQDVVLWEAPPPPERWGLPSETARLEVLTEFLEAPAPVKRIEPVWAVTDPDLRARLAEPDGVDEELDFGTFRISRGRAFAFGSAGAVELAGAPIVAKRWMILETSEGAARTVLFESVDYGSLMPVLERLPGFEPPALGMASRGSFSNRLAARDMDKPDLGYHYVPLDYVVDCMDIDGAVLELGNGVSVGVRGACGFKLEPGSKLISQGTPLALNRLVGCANVQEMVR